MEAKELRIGNYVYKEYHNYNDEKELEIDSEIHVIDELHNTNYETIKPIPLTEEWLLKFGFEKKQTVKGCTYYFEKVFRITIIDKNDLYINVFNSFGISNNNYHVHQLQNLYFSLTGKELICK